MKHSQVSRPFPAFSQFRTQSPGAFWSAGESPARQWTPFSPKHRVPVLVRMLGIRTELRGRLMMAGWKCYRKRNWIFYSFTFFYFSQIEWVQDSLPLGLLLLRRRPIKKYYLIPFSQSRSGCSPADKDLKDSGQHLSVLISLCALTYNSYKTFKQATGTMILLVYVGSVVI